MKKIKQEYIIDGPVEKVWNALVDPKEIDAWGGGPAKMSSKAGEEFELWGGDIHGTNVRVEKEKVLEQDWFGGEWDEASKLKFQLSEKDGKTKLVLTQENIPDKDAKDIDEGWHDYYLGPLKEYLENN